jgi:hypothetical protein
LFCSFFFWFFRASRGFFCPQLIKNWINLIIKATNGFAKNPVVSLSKGDSEMSKKGETTEQDRGKPQPRKKKEREDARKKKKLDRIERQKSR